MWNITAPQGAIIVAIAAIFGGVVSQAIGGLGFMLRRRVTGAHNDEALDRASKVVDFLAKAKAADLSDAELSQWDIFLRRPEIMSSASITKVIEQSVQDSQPAAFDSNMAMKMRGSAAYEVAEARLKQALTDLALLLRPDESEKFEQLQICWLAYRSALADFARQQFDGGSHAPLAHVMTALAETERRTVEVQTEIAERVRQCG